MNWIYRRGGARVRRGFGTAFGDSRIPCAFDWECRFRERAFYVPVLPDNQRSWSTALVWDWWGYRAHRTVYEAFTDVHRSGTFLDIGANDGTHSYLFALRGYSCFAFEPQSSCIDHLRSFCSRNNLENVTTVQTLVGEEDDAVVEFHTGDTSWVSSRLRQHTERFEPSRSTQMPSTSVDAYCRNANLAPTFMKIDVEGWEWPVLKGASATLGSFAPVVLVEVLSSNPDKDSIWDFFTKLGYGCVRLPSDLSGRFSQVTSKEQFLEDSLYSRDYLFSARHEFLESIGGR